MSDPNSFAKLVPGFEFLQSLSKNAGAALPTIGHWVAPTLNPEEIEKRIEELRTVKFWLEQNGRMLDATIQALEVQRMTLTTLKTMNVQMGDLREAMMIRKSGVPASDSESSGQTNNTSVASSAMSAATAAAAAFASAFQFPKAASSTSTTSAASSPDTEAPATHAAPPTGSPANEQAETPSPPHPAETSDAGSAPKTATGAGPIDPMQWWGALTRQFTALASSALQEGVVPGAVPSAPTSTQAAPVAPSTSGPARKKAAPAPRAAPRSASSAAGAPRKKAVRKNPGR